MSIRCPTEFELAIGDVVRIGVRMVTIVDVDGSEVSLRVEEVDPGGFPLTGIEIGRTAPPGK